MLLGLRSLWEATGTTPAEERGEFRKIRKKWPRAMRPRHVHWDDNVTLPSPAEIAQQKIARQIAEDDEIIALLASIL